MGHAVLLCLRTNHFTVGGNPRMELTEWTSLAEAVEAERVLCNPQCGPGCEFQHAVVYADGAIHVRRGSHDPPAPDLASLLARLYPRRLGDIPPPECWPAPVSLNEPLEKARVGSDLPARLARGRAVALRRGLATGPL